MTATNWDTSAAWEFHNATKYVVAGPVWDDDSFLMGNPSRRQPAMGEQDPELAPLAYKIYTELEPVPLPLPEAGGTMPALDAIARPGDLPAGVAIPELMTIARLCLRSNGLLKTWTNSVGRTIEFRAAGCTGARYHVELYLACGDLPGLDAGVYHYGAHDHALRRLRRGDFRRSVLAATGDEPAIAEAPVVFVTTSTFWRNAWRYQARAYRHVYWDTGTVLGNLLAVAADSQLPARTVLGFVDADINALLDVDGKREAAIALVALGRTADRASLSPPISPLELATQPISPREIDFPEIGAMHAASSLHASAEVKAWRYPGTEPTARDRGAGAIPLRPLTADQLPTDPIEQVIERRRSYRKYDTAQPLSFAAFSTVLERSGHPVRLDCLDAGDSPLSSRYLLVNNVEDLQPGVYAVEPGATELRPLRAGDVSGLAFELACYQTYAEEAHVNVYEMADLDRALRRFGNRGYRAAQLEAAIAGARLQLAAHALGLGAVGSTSLDDRVTETMSPVAKDLSFMFVAVFGERRRAPVSAG